MPKVTELDSLIDEARKMNEPVADPVTEWLSLAPKKTMLEAASPYMSDGDDEDQEEGHKQQEEEEEEGEEGEENPAVPSGMEMLHKQVKGAISEEGHTFSRSSMVTIEVSDESSEFNSSTAEE
jgi:hypothetical protein